MNPKLQEKIDKAIARLKAFCPPEGYYLAFSGGKDSIVCKQLLIESGCKFDAHYRVTSVDPPELVRYIKEFHPDVEREVPRDKGGKPITMWNLIPKRLMPPTRLVRYCCEQLKEGGGDGRMTVTGVRWAESASRKNQQGQVTIPHPGKKLTAELEQSASFAGNGKGGVILVNDNEESRRMIEQCYKRHKTTVNPIIDWSDDEVWEYIRDRNLPYCELYDRGFTRLGCIGCPMARQKGRETEFRAWPKYKAAYLRAFDAMLKERERRGKASNFCGNSAPTAVDVFNWWMQYDIMPGQIDISEIEEAE